MVLIDGKKTSEDIKNEIAAQVTDMISSGRRAPHLVAVLVGNDGASETYVANKVKACDRVGFRSTLLRFEDSISEEQLIEEIEKLNNNPEVDGFIVQLPLPKHISTENITLAILPDKDVDGFHPANVGRMVLNMPSYLPATPYGIMELIGRYKIPTDGKHCVVIGRSNIVGSPMSILMAKNAYPGNCTVTLCHSRTENLVQICRTADILIVALGKPEFVTADMVKPGAAVIDVGITRVVSPSSRNGYTLKGDVNFDAVAPKAGFITPVPGGVGPMTIAMLLQNTLRAAQHKVYGPRVEKSSHHLA